MAYHITNVLATMLADDVNTRFRPNNRGLGVVPDHYPVSQELIELCEAALKTSPGYKDLKLAIFQHFGKQIKHIRESVKYQELHPELFI